MQKGRHVPCIEPPSEGALFARKPTQTDPTSDRQPQTTDRIGTAASTPPLQFCNTMASNLAARTACRSISKVKSSAWSKVQARALSSAPQSGYTHDEPIPSNYTIDSVKPPQYWAKPDGKCSRIWCYLKLTLRAWFLLLYCNAHNLFMHIL